MNFSKYLLLRPRNIILLLVSWILAVLLHNAFYALFGFEEAVFFILSVIIIPLYFIISLIYSLFFVFSKKKNKTSKKKR